MRRARKPSSPLGPKECTRKVVSGEEGAEASARRGEWAGRRVWGGGRGGAPSGGVGCLRRRGGRGENKLHLACCAWLSDSTSGMSSSLTAAVPAVAGQLTL